MNFRFCVDAIHLSGSQSLLSGSRCDKKGTTHRGKSTDKILDAFTASVLRNRGKGFELVPRRFIEQSVKLNLHF
jgi:hypothetical protein